MTGHLVYVRSVYIIIHNCVYCIYSLKAIVRNLEVGIHLFYIFIVSEEGTLCLESSNAIQILVLSEKKISTNHCIFFSVHRTEFELQISSNSTFQRRVKS